MGVTRPTAEAYKRHQENSKHRLTNPLRDVILGGQDGVVNALGIVLGVSAAGGSIHILIATVLAASAAESISMGAVAYTSAISQRDHYESEKLKEEKEIEEDPEIEKEEVRQIFEKKGFSGHVLEEIVTTITSDKKSWLDTMMREELGLEKINTKNILKSSLIVGVTTAIGSMVPLLPFFLANGMQLISYTNAVIFSIVICGIALFAVGAYQAISLVGSWWRSGIRMVVIGLSAAFVGYLLARLIQIS